MNFNFRTILSLLIKTNLVALIYIVTGTETSTTPTQIQIQTQTLTPFDALNLAPILFESLPTLQDILITHQLFQTQIAAIKIRSLIPNYQETPKKNYKSLKSLKFDSSLNAAGIGSDSDSGSNSETELEIETADHLIFKPLKALLSQLLDDHFEEVKAFDFNSQSLDEFVTVKSLKAEEILYNALPLIQAIQSHLPPNLGSNFQSNLTPTRFTQIVSVLENLKEEFEEINELQKRLVSSKESKRSKANLKIQKNQIKLVEIIGKLTKLL